MSKKSKNGLTQFLSSMDPESEEYRIALERMEQRAASMGQTERPLTEYANDPLQFQADYWPDVRFFNKQIEIIESVRDNDETVVVAAHQLGKDYTAAFIILWYFLTRHPVRIVTTSVRDDHTRILFGEIGRFVETCAVPLSHKKGGPLVLNYHEIKKMVNGQVCPISYLIGTVSQKGEGLAGHHAPHTLFVADEASGVEEIAFERTSTWSKKRLIFGNAYGLSHWFHKAVKGGDILALPN